MDPRRHGRIADLAGREFDVLVIGGGITGAGIARDAALRGLSVALVERGDIAHGTSSRSSRLIHGGIRYLEHGHLRLVLEASRERRRLLRLAPHLVRPLQFIWPVYRAARVPLWKLGIGMWLYDALAAFRNVGRHRQLSAAAVRAREPALRPDNLRGGQAYWDASTDDARLTLATALDAMRSGAVVMNHAEAVALDVERDRVRGARVRDRIGGTTVPVRARLVVNAAGPWSDEIRRMEGARTIIMRGSRGSHVSVPRARLGIHGAVTLLSPVDGRVFFVLPEGTRAVIGTTDVFTDVPPDQVRATGNDVNYLLRSASHFFPEAALNRGDVLAAWAGVRPLVAQERTSERASSREHRIDSGPAGLLTITGGKLTTYRIMGADVVDAVMRRLGRDARRSPTEDRPLPGGAMPSLEREAAAAAAALGDPAVGELLASSYGMEWRRIAELMAVEPELGERVVAGRPETFAQLVYGIEQELACTLGDLLIRRTRLAWQTEDQGRAAARRAADVLAARYGWSDERRTREVAAYEMECAALFTIEPAR